jgi:hypothetical protein
VLESGRGCAVGEMLWTLRRVEVGPDGAFGELTIAEASRPWLYTVERTYTVDSAEVIKIPPGTYHCIRTRYYHGQCDTYEVQVPEHSRLLFHPGNLETDSDGCIIVGMSRGWLNGKPAVLRSRVGFALFMQLCAGRSGFDMKVIG